MCDFPREYEKALRVIMKNDGQLETSTAMGGYEWKLWMKTIETEGCTVLYVLVTTYMYLKRMLHSRVIEA